MAEIRLLTVKHYAAICRLSRQTVWRQVKDGSLDYYLLITQKGLGRRKWFAVDEPTRRRILNLRPTIL